MLEPNINLDRLDKKELAYLQALLEEKQKRDLCLLYNSFPDEDKQLSPKVVAYSRHKYKKHMAFFDSGKDTLIRVFMAGNRCGKSFAGAEEIAMHATGLYPDWWTGRRFSYPPRIWVASTTADKTMKILQHSLFGSPDSPHLRFIPEHLLAGDPTPKHGTSGAYSDAFVKHATGGTAVITFKDYKQGRQAFEGQTIDCIWLDEEASLEIFEECKARIMNTTGQVGAQNGALFLTFTPLEGLTPLIQYLKTEAKHTKNVKIITAEWDDVPHLSAEVKEEMLQGMPPHIRDARMRGIPFMGTGAIYPIPINDILIDPIKIQPHWKVSYGLDEGLQCTAAVWGALDPDTDVLYIYAEYVGRNQLARVNAELINERGDMPGAVDNSAMRTSPTDGLQVINAYIQAGLNLTLADKSVESGIQMVWERLNTGRLKIFKTCPYLRAEYEIYHRDEKGEPVRTNIHLMDALRYLVKTGLQVAVPYLSTQGNGRYYEQENEDDYGNRSIQGRNTITGY